MLDSVDVTPFAVIPSSAQDQDVFSSFQYIDSKQNTSSNRNKDAVLLSRIRFQRDGHLRQHGRHGACLPSRKESLALRQFPHRSTSVYEPAENTEHALIRACTQMTVVQKEILYLKLGRSTLRSKTCFLLAKICFKSISQ